MITITAGLLTLLCTLMEAQMKTPQSQPTASLAIQCLLAGAFQWHVSKPLVAPTSRPANPSHAIKDPSIVHYDSKWHLFCTIRSRKPTHQIEYLTFTDWQSVDKARRHVLDLGVSYFCAPQAFYFAPQKKWYLIYQASDESWQPKYQAAFSTTANIADPTSWSKAKPLGATKGLGKAWLDFWVICDDTKAYLFFTSLDGHMWRAETRLADFPHGWTEPKVVLKDDVFEASHTYLLKGLGKYLTVIEAENKTDKNRRYYKAYIADSLDGEWKPLAATKNKPFASPVNTKDTTEHWTDSFSHVELLRVGCDQRLEVDPANLRVLFQGVSDEARSGKGYGDIPWRLGILEAAQ